MQNLQNAHLVTGAFPWGGDCNAATNADTNIVTYFALDGTYAAAKCIQQLTIAAVSEEIVLPAVGA